MTTEVLVTSEPKAVRIAGYVLSILGGLMLFMGGMMNVLKAEFAVKNFKELGYPEQALVPLGIVTILAVVLYLIPRTSVLGAIILTGYLGGAIDHHVHHGDGLGHIIVPAIFAALLWTGLILRDSRLRSLLPVRV